MNGAVKIAVASGGLIGRGCDIDGKDLIDVRDVFGKLYASLLY